jgi:uncharacterized protein YjcR
MTSLEQRDQIKQLIKDGVKAPQIASQLGISVHTVRKWQQIVKKGVRCTHQWVGPQGVP